MASSIAAMITSGLMFFSRLICSICCRSWLAMVLPEFHCKPSMRDLVERDARHLSALLLQGEAHEISVDGEQAAGPVPPSLDGLVGRDVRQASDESPVVGLRAQRPVEARGRSLQSLRAVDLIVGVEDGGTLLGHQLELVEPDPAGLVDVEPDEAAAAAPLDLDVDQLEAAIGADALGNAPNGFGRVSAVQ